MCSAQRLLRELAVKTMLALSRCAARNSHILATTLAQVRCDRDEFLFMPARIRIVLGCVLDFAGRRLGKPPKAMQLADMRPELILAFLDRLEQGRKNATRSRNLRLAALRAFLKFAARRDVTPLHDIERTLAVPMKRFERPILGFLTRPEMLAVLGQPGELSEAALLPNTDGQAMSRSNDTQRLSLAATRATVAQPSLTSHAQTHERHALAAVGRAVQRDRPVARTRERDNDPSIGRGRPGDEGESARTAGWARDEDGPLNRSPPEYGPSSSRP